DGAFTGTVIATSTGGAVRSPISIAREVESYTVTVNHIGPDGQPATDSSTALVELGTMKAYGFYEEDGSSTVRLPKGDYFGSTYIVTQPNWAVLTQPKLTISKDTTITLDARVAKPVKVSVPEPTAEGMLGEYSVTRRSGQKTTGYGLIYFSDFGDTLTTAQVGLDVAAADLTARMGVQWRGTPSGDTPINYRFGSSWAGKVPTGHVRDLGKKDFAEVRTTVGPSPEGRTHAHALLGTNPDGGGGWSWIAPMGESGTMVDLVAGDNTTWGALYEQVSGNSLETEQVTPPKAYKAGKRYELKPNHAVFSPGLDGYPRALGRTGDSIRAAVPLFSDNRGGEGYSLVDSAKTTLFRNGTKVGEAASTGGAFTVPAEAGAYRLETKAVRSGVSELSTEVSGTWTFRSAHVDGQETKPLPLSVIRFLPALDQKDTSPAGRLIAVPLVVQQNPDADNGRVNHITVDVSFDDGKTWRHTPVIGKSALIHNGPAGSFASLRAKTTDSKGNTADITVIRAYRITGK
ncbi:MAG TPA: peptidase S8, partial [Umezawaea sp.]|nr:peptidase S8 [Umezawaea sp.]